VGRGTPPPHTPPPRRQQRLELYTFSVSSPLKLNPRSAPEQESELIWQTHAECSVDVDVKPHTVQLILANDSLIDTCNSQVWLLQFLHSWDCVKAR